MLKQLKTRKSEGFTIIEVLIVLAIAGLIIAIVLFAVPALQRNGRNTAIKNDVNTIAGQISDFESNNDGAPPTTIGATSGALSITGASGTTPTTGKIQAGTAVNQKAAVTAGNAFADPGAGTIFVYPTNKCGTGLTSGSSTSTRAFALVYDIETSGGTATKCQDV